MKKAKEKVKGFLSRRSHLKPPASSTPSSKTGSSGSLASNSTSPPELAQTCKSLVLGSQNPGLWETAQLCLSEEDRKILQIGDPSAPSDAKMAPEELINIVKSKRNDLENKRWDFEFRGRSIRPRDIADSITVWLGKFQKVIDVGSNASPVIVGLPWAGIKSLLLISLSEITQMRRLLLGVDQALYIIARCKIYESLYPPDPNHAIPRRNLETALIGIYEHILRFLAEALRIYQRSTTSRALHATLLSEKAVEFQEGCKQMEQRVEMEAANCERAYNKVFRREVASFKVLLEDIVSQREHIDRIDTGVTEVRRTLNEAERGRILNWTSDIPYEDHHQTAAKGRTEGTGEWLIQHENYRLWQSSSQSMVLWLHGRPGAGKTKLISRAVDHLLADRPDEHALAYFYCYRNEDSRRNPENILRSFVQQLATPRDRKSVYDSLVQVYREKQSTGFASQQLNFKECEGLILKLAGNFQQVTLIIDALDECEIQTRGEIFKLLQRIIHWPQPPRLKVLISSRPDRDIQHYLGQNANIGIRATDNEDDIRKFILERIDQSQADGYRTISKDLQEEIAETLLTKSKGMFQYAALQIADILELELEADIRDRLGRLPEGLKELYDEIYKKIETGKGSKPVIAKRAFQWVICSYLPLWPEALCAAVCQDPEDDATKQPNVSISYILEACCNLLFIDDRSLCRLSHLSVREYFEAHHWSIEHCHGVVAKVYLSLLNNPENWALDTRSRIPTELMATSHVVVLKYARARWMIHLNRHGTDQIDARLSMLFRKFLGSLHESSPAYRSWQQSILSLPSSPTGQFLNRSELEPNSSSLLAMSLFGFDKVISDWWDPERINPNQLNDSGHSLLILATLGGSLSVTKKLLEMGADVNLKTEAGRFDTPLWGSALEAAVGGTKDIVQLLLDWQADVNMRLSHGQYGSALAAAAALRMEVTTDDAEILKLLLDAGADVNMQLSTGRYGSALAAAAGSYEKNDKIQMLLDAGADVNMPLQSGEFGSALAASARLSSSPYASIQVLLDSGADVNMHLNHGQYGSALAVAAVFNKKAVVQLLLDAGADANMKLNSDDSDGSALAAAVAYGDKDLLQLLLDSGADPNMQLSSGYGSALMGMVAEFDRSDSRQQEQGADDYHYQLYLRATFNAAEKFRCLLDAGASVDMMLDQPDLSDASRTKTARTVGKIRMYMLAIFLCESTERLSWLFSREEDEEHLGRSKDATL